ncbi:hypothetical protein D3C75_1015860 [compost metagenome]
MAGLTSYPVCWSTPSASSRAAPVASTTIRHARSISFTLVAFMSTIRFWYTLPNFTIAPVEIMFSTSFCAVPDFMRVEPVRASGPTTGEIAIAAT